MDLQKHPVYLVHKQYINNNTGLYRYTHISKSISYRLLLLCSPDYYRQQMYLFVCPNSCIILWRTSRWIAYSSRKSDVCCHMACLTSNHFISISAVALYLRDAPPPPPPRKEIRFSLCDSTVS